MINVYRVDSRSKFEEYFQPIVDFMYKSYNMSFMDEEFEIFLDLIKRRIKELDTEERCVLKISRYENVREGTVVCLKDKKGNYICRIFAISGTLYFYDEILDNFITGKGEQW